MFRRDGGTAEGRGATVGGKKRFHTLRTYTLGLLAIGIFLTGVGIAPKNTSSNTIKYVAPVSQEFLEPDPEAVQQLYQEWLASKVQKKVSFNPCSCVSLVKALTGYTQSVGRARNWPINSKWPAVGSVVVTSESSAGHVAYIIGIEGNTLLLDETNWMPCQRGKRRLSMDDPSILGFWNP